MAQRNKTLSIASSPHINSGASVNRIMADVVMALLPLCAFAVYGFGLSALLVLVTAITSCVLTEYALNKRTEPATIKDGSALITGILYGLTLPPSLPLWMVACGGVIAVAMGKFLFGGLGYNAFNPALVGRAFLQAAFPAAMTHWLPIFSPERFSSLPSSSLTLPFAAPVYDGISSATPLARMKFEQLTSTYSDLYLGFSSGSAGETCSVLIVLGGVYLAARNVINWRIPVAILATVALLSGTLHWWAPAQFADPVFMVFSGGLMLGAVFMATDMVASPMTHLGVTVYGVLIGVLVVVIRFWGGMPEGVMYAILLANAVSPHIDRLTQPKVFGARRGTGP